MPDHSIPFWTFHRSDREILRAFERVSQHREHGDALDRP